MSPLDSGVSVKHHRTSVSRPKSNLVD